MADPAAGNAGIEAALTPRGLRVERAALAARLGGAAQLSRFLAKLTVTEQPLPGRPKMCGRPKKVDAFAAEGGRLFLPRAKIPALVRAGVLRLPLADERPPPRSVLPSRRLVAPGRELSRYQEVAFAHLRSEPLGPEAVAAGHSVAYFQMGAGLGKTRFAIVAIARLGLAALVVVPTDYIRGQWLKELAATCPGLRCAPYANPPKGSRRAAPSFEDYDVLVGIINTIRAKPPEFFAGCGTLVLDEAHEYCSPCNIEILRRGQGPRYLLGLSATPGNDKNAGGPPPPGGAPRLPEGRPDGIDRVVHHFLGPPVRADSIPGCDVGSFAFTGRVREVEYAGHPDHCQPAIGAGGMTSAIGTIGNVIGDPARLRLVAAEVERLYRLHEGPEAAAFGLGGGRRHGVLVFAEHRDYLPALREALLARIPPADLDVPELAEAAPAGPTVLRGGADAGTVAAAQRARIVLTTYGYSRRGVSIVEMTSEVYASPRRNGHVQIMGRAERRGSDPQIVRVFVDICDVRTSLKTQKYDRRAVYKAKGYPIYRVRADHTRFEPPPGDRPPGAPPFPHVPASPTAEEQLVWAPPPAPGADPAGLAAGPAEGDLGDEDEGDGAAPADVYVDVYGGAPDSPRH